MFYKKIEIKEQLIFLKNNIDTINLLNMKELIAKKENKLFCGKTIFCKLLY